MCCNPVHTISNVVKMAKVFKKLDEINFAIDPEKDSELIGTVVNFVKVSNLSADEIVNEVLEMHTLEMAAL
ncbi:MAG: hypothetical protein FK734_11095 [Asgard group archaeon]|nr:hypothetical protein [Asgard group archaeon]